MKDKKIIISSIIFILLFTVTFTILFLTYKVSDILLCLKMINISYYIIIILGVFLYFFLEGLYFKVMFNSMNEKISLIRCFHYALVEFFFSGITPGSTGGQPLQLYYMNQDKLSNKKSMISLILNTILFKLFLIVGGILILIFKPDYVFTNGSLVKILFFLGFIYDIFIVVICLLLMYNQKLISKILTIIYKIYNKFTNKNIDYNTKIDEITKSYVDEAIYLKENVGVLFLTTILVFIQRTILFSIIYFIYRSLNTNIVLNYFDILLLQLFVQISLELCILPGQTGISEYITSILYLTIFDTLAIHGMILNRLFIFYLPLLISFVLIIINVKVLYKSKDR